MAKQPFSEVIKSTDTPVLVDFYADWCGPCKTMNPVVEQLAKEYAGKIRVVKVNVDKNQAAAQQFRVQGVPTFILFKNGEVIWKQAGAVPAHQLAQVIQRNI